MKLVKQLRELAISFEATRHLLSGFGSCDDRLEEVFREVLSRTFSVTKETPRTAKTGVVKDEAWAAIQYLRGNSTCEIAAQLKCDPSVVNRMLRGQNIKIRTKQEAWRLAESKGRSRWRKTWRSSIV